MTGVATTLADPGGVLNTDTEPHVLMWGATQYALSAEQYEAADRLVEVAASLVGRVDHLDLLLWAMSLGKDWYGSNHATVLDAIPPTPADAALILGWLQGVSQSNWIVRQGRFLYARRLVAADADVAALLALAPACAQVDMAKDIARYRASPAALQQTVALLTETKSARKRAEIADILMFAASPALLAPLQAARATESNAKAQNKLDLAILACERASAQVGQRGRARGLRGQKIALVGDQFFEGRFSLDQTRVYLHHLSQRARFLGAVLVDPEDADIIFVARDTAADPTWPGNVYGARDLFELLGVRWFCKGTPQLSTIGDWVVRLSAFVEILRAHPDVTVSDYTLGDPLTDAQMDAMNEAVNADLRALCRQANGIRLSWQMGDTAGCINILPLQAVLSSPMPPADDLPTEVAIVDLPAGTTEVLEPRALYARLRALDAYTDDAKAAILTTQDPRFTRVYHVSTDSGFDDLGLSLTAYLEGVLNLFGDAAFRARCMRRDRDIAQRNPMWGLGRSGVMFCWSP
ncbi:MAG: hypothetical protein AAFV53_25165 [Myxococcota bacterium]